MTQYNVRFHPCSDYPWKVVNVDQGLIEIIASFSTLAKLRKSYWVTQGRLLPENQWPTSLFSKV